LRGKVAGATGARRKSNERLDMAGRRSV
jgi:hypothetical protein